MYRALCPKFDFGKSQTCHLDPDIYEDIEGRTATDEWKPAFGQHGVSAVHLDKLGVGVGDIFLFYGMFQKTMVQSDKTLCFDRTQSHKFRSCFGVEAVTTNSCPLQAEFNSA